MTTDDKRPDFWDEPNLAMDEVIWELRRQAELGAEACIWRLVRMPMGKPGYRDLDLLEAPIEVAHESRGGHIEHRPIEPGWDRDMMLEDELAEMLAGHPPETRYPMLEMSRARKAPTPELLLSHHTLSAIMAQSHEATAAAMAAQRVRREGSGE